MDIQKPKLIIAIEHPLFVKGVIVTLQDDFHVSAVADDGRELLNLLKTEKADLVILGLRVPYTNGLNTVKTIALDYPLTKIVALSVVYIYDLECQLKSIGASGYLSKDIDCHCLTSKIKDVLEGHDAFEAFTREKDWYVAFDKQYSPKHNLSHRELQIISLIRAGLTSNQIAQKLFISINTVETHRKNIFKKLRLKNIQGVVDFACRHSL